MAIIVPSGFEEGEDHEPPKPTPHAPCAAALCVLMELAQRGGRVRINPNSPSLQIEVPGRLGTRLRLLLTTHSGDIAQILRDTPDHSWWTT